MVTKDKFINNKKSRLTDREKEVVKEVFKGKSNKFIASDLGMKENTLESHMKNIHQKTNTHSKAELMIWAADNPDEVN